MTGWLLDMRPRGAGGGSSPVAPVDATYITQTPNATLTNEQALSFLATGLLKSTTGTGVLSIAVPTVDFASAAQGSLADTALQPAAIGVTVQAWDADLDTIAGLAKTDGNFIVGDGAAWVVESGATVRTSLGLGSLAVINDAPSDGSTYGRNNAAWAVVSASSIFPVVDTQTIIKGSADPTKLLRFEVDGFTAGATRVLTPPNQDATIAGLEVANVFTTTQTIRGSSTKLLDVIQTGTLSDATEPMTSNTTPSPNVASASTEANPSNAAWRGFSHNILDKWTANASTGWLKYDFGSGNAVTATRYRINGPIGGQESQGPRDWTFEGSNDNAAWTVLDTQAGVSWASAALLKTYTFINSTAYRYYRLNITAINGGALVSLTELQIDHSQITLMKVTGTSAGFGPFDSDYPFVTNNGMLSLTSDVANFKGIVQSPNQRLLMRQQGGSLGESSFELANEVNFNGAKIAITGASNLVDLQFAHPGNSQTVRLEGRTAQSKLGTSDEWQFGIPSSPHSYFSSAGAFFPAFRIQDTATTNAVVKVVQISLNSTGTPAAGFGPGILITGESSTTVDTNMGRFTYEWATATHASRKALSKWTVYDTAEREAIRIEASGSAPMLGFLGKTAIARPTTYTLASTATRTMPTPEAAFTGQDNLQVGAVYAKSADIITLQTRLDAVEGVLRQLIIDLASTSGYGLLVAS